MRELRLFPKVSVTGFYLNRGVSLWTKHQPTRSFTQTAVATKIVNVAVHLDLKLSLDPETADGVRLTGLFDARIRFQSKMLLGGTEFVLNAENNNSSHYKVKQLVEHGG